MTVMVRRLSQVGVWLNEIGRAPGHFSVSAKFA
jgi:hypothetical protein